MCGHIFLSWLQVWVLSPQQAVSAPRSRVPSHIVLGSLPRALRAHADSSRTPRLPWAFIVTRFFLYRIAHLGRHLNGICSSGLAPPITECRLSELRHTSEPTVQPSHFIRSDGRQPGREGPKSSHRGVSLPVPTSPLSQPGFMREGCLAPRHQLPSRGSQTVGTDPTAECHLELIQNAGSRSSRGSAG